MSVNDLTLKRNVFLKVKFKFSDRLPARLVGEMLALLEESVFESDMAELEYIESEIAGIPIFIRDAVHQRIQHYKDKNLLLKKAKEGSIVFTGSIPSVVVWVLSRIVKESLKPGLRNADWQEKIIAYLKKSESNRAKVIADRFAEKTEKAFDYERDELIFRYEIADDTLRDGTLLTLYIYFYGTDLPPNEYEVSLTSK